MLSFADPSVATLLWTCFSTLVLLASGAVALAMLPWSDEQVRAVDDEVRALAAPSPRAALRRS